ncbi:MAG: zinc-ribbon domain-containing protein [Azoarcus sp.]|jgi:predicted Zn finger-like uncharacterized protein|nr:zinc-ribbon domain-containing protein [Azoarcus sp.]
MLTRCPSCQTVFRLTAEQLLARQGRVRCGNCLHPFNALDYLADPEAVLPGAETAVAPAPPAAKAGTDLPPPTKHALPRGHDDAFHAAETQPFSIADNFGAGEVFPPRANASLLPKPRPRPRPVLAPVVKKSSQRQLSELDFSSSIDSQSRRPRIVSWSSSLKFPELDVIEEEEETSASAKPAPPPPPARRMPPAAPSPTFAPGNEVHSMLDMEDDLPPPPLPGHRRGKQNRALAPDEAGGEKKALPDSVVEPPPELGHKRSGRKHAPVPEPGGEERTLLDDDEPPPKARHDGQSRKGEKERDREKEKARARDREKEKEKGREREQEKKTDRSKRSRHGGNKLSFFSRGETQKSPHRVEAQKSPHRVGKHRENEHGSAVQPTAEVIDEETLGEIFTKFGIETKINWIEAEFDAESKAVEATKRPVVVEAAPRSHKAASYFDAYGKPISARTRAIWISSISMLSVLLIVQATFLFRHGISRAFPDTRPFFVLACGSFGCEMPLPRDASLIRLDDYDFILAQPELPGQYSFYAKVKNEARFAQDWPHLELTLLDGARREIARRVFTPDEWVPPEKRASGRFAPRDEITTRIDLEVDGRAPENFKIAHFYP